MLRFASLSLMLLLAIDSTTNASTIESGVVTSDLVPRPVEYSVLLPDGYNTDGERYPLVWLLAGGPGKKSGLEKHSRRTFDHLWQSGELPEVVAVMASVRPHCGYVDFADGSEKWESVLLGPFLEHIRKTYHVTRDPKRTVVFGGSMGGVGALQMAMRHPDMFAAVVAVSPGIMPALKWKDVPLRNRSFLCEAHWKALYGDPIDARHWAEFNPPSILAADPKRVRDSKIKIYLECGDDDSLLLHEGTEFFHRLLWDNAIRHEYRSLHGYDHGGKRGEADGNAALRFVSRVLRSDFGDPKTQRFFAEIRARGGFPGASASDEDNARFTWNVVKALREQEGETPKPVP